jgi:hypothetical protein
MKNGKQRRSNWEVHTGDEPKATHNSALRRDLQKEWHGHLARDSWAAFAMGTAVFHGQDARATTSARGSQHSGLSTQDFFSRGEL